MIFLNLFFTFLKIGAVSFGGGYGMISMIRDECLSHGWMNDGELLNFIAVAESTPGPIAVNMATFVGSSEAGFLGALCATLGIVLPSFAIILIIAAWVANLMKYKYVQAALGGIRPAIVGLILGTGITMLLRVLLSFVNVYTPITFDWRVLVILTVIAAASLVWKRWRKQPLSPILLILSSGVLGILLY